MAFVVTGTQCLMFISFKNYPIKIKIWECSILHYLNTSFEIFLYVLHLQWRVHWTFPSLLETFLRIIETSLRLGLAQSFGFISA